MILIELLRWILGVVTVRISGGNAERFINLMTSEKTEFWNIKKSERGVEFSIGIKDFKKLKRLHRRSDVHIKILKKQGLPFFVKRYKKRIGFAAGVLSFAAIMVFLSSMIWTVRVSGCDSELEEKVRAALYGQGVKPFSFKSELDVAQIQRNVMLEVDELSWIGINMKGSVADVGVRRREAPPQIDDVTTPRNIVAAEDGVIEEIWVKAGEAVVKKGDSVKKGQLLVSGVVEGAKSGTVYYVAASADIRASAAARVETVQMYTETVKAPTGRSCARRVLYVGDMAINLYLGKDVPYDEYVAVEDWGKVKLGFSEAKMKVTEYYESCEKPVQISAERAETLGRTKGNAEVAEYLSKYSEPMLLYQSTNIFKGAKSLTIQNEIEFSFNIASIIPIDISE